MGCSEIAQIRDMMKRQNEHVTGFNIAARLPKKLCATLVLKSLSNFNLFYFNTIQQLTI